MNNIANLSSWAIGALNGASHKPLPDEITHKTLIISAGLNTLHYIGNTSILAPHKLLAGICISVPLVTGMTYFLGKGVGSGIKHYRASETSSSAPPQP
jgi:hypothetical protein